MHSILLTVTVIGTLSLFACTPQSIPPSAPEAAQTSSSLPSDVSSLGSVPVAPAELSYEEKTGQWFEENKQAYRSPRLPLELDYPPVIDASEISFNDDNAKYCGPLNKAISLSVQEVGSIITLQEGSRFNWSSEEKKCVTVEGLSYEILAEFAENEQEVVAFVQAHTAPYCEMDGKEVAGDGSSITFWFQPKASTATGWALTEQSFTCGISRVTYYPPQQLVVMYMNPKTGGGPHMSQFGLEFFILDSIRVLEK